MDETQTGWYRWIARNSHHLFALVWGIGMGAFGAVIFGVVDTGGDGVRIYIAILTLLMAGALGLISSRAMDHYSDQRKIRRKIFNMLVRVRALHREMSALSADCIRINPERFQTLEAIVPLLTEENVRNILLRCDRVRRVAQSAPDFDEIVETETEAGFAQVVLSRFAFSVEMFGIDKLEDEPRKKAYVAGMISLDFLENTHIDDALNHYEARIRHDG